MSRPLAIDLYCGLGGWTEGFLPEGYDVVGFDIEEHVYGAHRYPAQLVVQDVLTLHGAQFRDAAAIVASPPCQEYAYMSYPWARGKQIAAALRGKGEFPEGFTGSRSIEELNALFAACFRIQREACEAAGRHIPLVVENVRGAQKWVGRARWNYGSFYLWGDVPALMPKAIRQAKVPGLNWSKHGDPDYRGEGFNTHADRQLREGVKVGDAGWAERGPGRQFQDRAIKNSGGSWFNVAHNTASGKGQNPDGRLVHIRDDHSHTRHLTNPAEHEGVKQSGISGTRVNGKGDRWFQDGAAKHGSKSPGRKAASAIIAKIPPGLARHIARTFRP